MRALLLAFLIVMMPMSARASPLEKYQWEHRVVLVFEDSLRPKPPPNDPYSVSYEANEDGIIERDIIIFTIGGTYDSFDDAPVVGTFPAREDTYARWPNTGFGKALREHYNYRDQVPEETVLIGKDGEVKQRWDGYPDWEQVFKAIDVMPMRQREMQD